MCGISGGWWRQPSPANERRVTNSLEVMRRRGPDDRGVEVHNSAMGSVVLAQVRLSIIDLSSGGHQPMTTADGRLSMVYNGELYNYRELREELRELGHKFRSDSDSEVLLTAWRQWGDSCLPRLVGMFAFVVHDREEQSMTLVRDPYGIKPLMYRVDDQRLIFASEIPAIQEIAGSKGELDWQQAYDYLVYGRYDTGSRTFLDGVHQLRPGHILRFDLRTGLAGQPDCWWVPDLREREDLTFADAVELVREEFLTSVRLHLRSDVPIGAALSGGVDSSAVVCAMRQIEPDLPINTFSFIAKDHPLSEEVWVDQINEHVGAKPNKLTAGSDDLLEHLDDMIRAQGEPFGSTSIYAQYRVFKLAKERGITVTLDGQGADEMLGGYVGYPGERIRSLVDRGRLAEAAHFYNAWSKWPGRSRLMATKAALSELLPTSVYELMRKANGRMVPSPAWINETALHERGILCQYPVRPVSKYTRGRRLAAELMQELTASRLPSLLRHGDRNSMHFSIESRVPFLSPNLVQLMLSMPEEYLISRDGETKHVFRQAMRGIVPDSILDRRDKIGFDTPEREWLMPLEGKIREWLSVDLKLAFFDGKAVQREADAIFSNQKPFTLQLWRWVNFMRWYVNFLE